MATHSSVLAWRIPGTGEPGGLLSVGSHRVGHNRSDLAAAAAERGKETGEWPVSGAVRTHATFYGVSSLGVVRGTPKTITVVMSEVTDHRSP